MARVAVFDSGLGSLSVIRAIRAAARCEIVYFADRENFPYGNKSRRQLGRIIGRTVRALREEFAPDVIVMASNTPSLVLGCGEGVIGVFPPVRQAARASATGNIAVLGTGAAVASRGMADYIARQRLPAGTTVHRINASPLVDLVEDGAFLTDEARCRGEIRAALGKRIRDGGIDAATLSSTHLPFLRPLLESEFPGVGFLDPAESVAAEVAGRIGESGRAGLRVYTSGDARELERDLARLGIRSRAGRFTA